MGDGTVDRRRFIGFGIAAAGTAAVVGPGPWTARASLTWSSVAGFPGRPNRLALQAPDLPDGAAVEITVQVEGPDPEQPVTVLATLTAHVSGGHAEVESAMTYPYEGRLAGEYRYVADASWRGATVQTSAPATYSVIDWLPLS
jgi:hypothetical protein